MFHVNFPGCIPLPCCIGRYFVMGQSRFQVVDQQVEGGLSLTFSIPQIVFFLNSWNLGNLHLATKPPGKSELAWNGVGQCRGSQRMSTTQAVEQTTQGYWGTQLQPYHRDADTINTFWIVKRGCLERPMIWCIVYVFLWEFPSHTCTYYICICISLCNIYIYIST